jgi:hypothetical protein
MSVDLFAAFGADAQENPWASESSASRPHEQNTQRAALPGISPSSQAPNVSRTRPEKAGYLWQPSSSGNDVLFDAEDEGEGNGDDDFGDFEDVNLQKDFDRIASAQSASEDALRPAKLIARSEPLIDLLSLDNNAPTKQQPNAHSSSFAFASPQTISSPTVPALVPTPEVPEDDEWGDFEERQHQPQPQPHPSTRPKQPKSTPRRPTTLSQVPPAPAPDPEDDWPAFEDGQPEQSPPAYSAPQATSASRSLKARVPPLRRDRPTTIPPPALLFSILPTIFHSLKDTPSQTEILTAHHTTSRLLAGRTHRWKRDTLLSQSIRIAAAGKPGGMKLASLNKSESAREEREAAEAVDVWNSNLHYWASVVSKAKVHAGPLKLSTSVTVKTAQGPGVMEAKDICALCGLKRNERVVGVDEGVEDVFGEFWCEGWGHRECVEWWEVNQGLLSKR